MNWRTRFLWLGILIWCVTIGALAQNTNLSSIGGFEGTLPAYWNMGNTGGATLSWATDQARSGLRSIKIEKTTTGDSAEWVSDNMCDIWSPTHTNNVDIFLGAWVRTENVNVNPATEDAKWYLAFEFYDSAGAAIGTWQQPVPQSVASTGAWVADTNSPGDVILPKDSWKTIVKFVAGKEATGTVWVDDVMFYGRAGVWAGQDWGTNMEYPTGWYYWLPPIGGNDGEVANGFENTVVTTEAAHSGLHSLKFAMPFDRQVHDGFVGTKRVLFASGNGMSDMPAAMPVDITKLQGVSEGDMLRVTVWLKASDLVPDSAALYPGEWSVGLTPLWFTTVGNNDGYSPVGPSPDYTWEFPPVTSFDWTPYTLDLEVPTGVDAKALEVRLHVYNRFTGTIYWDDLTVDVIGTTTAVGGAKDGLPSTYELSENYPNPFNPSTTIQYGVPRDGAVAIDIYNVMGQKIRTLVDDYRAAGRYVATWDGRDDRGYVVGSGVYFYRLTSGNTGIVKKMLLLK
jgi:hypothetical protein